MSWLVSLMYLISAGWNTQIMSSAEVGSVHKSSHAGSAPGGGVFKLDKLANCVRRRAQTSDEPIYCFDWFSVAQSSRIDRLVGDGNALFWLPSTSASRFPVHLVLFLKTE